MPTCVGRNCRAEIEFAVVASAKNPEGTRHPFDPGTVGGDAGTLALVQAQDGKWSGRYLRKERPLEDDEQRAVSHYATCPDADRFRR